MLKHCCVSSSSRYASILVGQTGSIPDGDGGLQDNDDDLTALSVSSPSVQAEVQQPEVTKAAAGISLGNAAASLADCEDTGHNKRLVRTR